MNAKEIIREYLIADRLSVMEGYYLLTNDLVDDLLALTYPCPECNGEKVVKDPFPKYEVDDEATCPACKGTGDSGIKVLAIRDIDQTLPNDRIQSKFTKMDALSDKIDYADKPNANDYRIRDAIAVNIAYYQLGQQDMVNTGWVKEVKE